MAGEPEVRVDHVEIINTHQFGVYLHGTSFRWISADLTDNRISPAPGGCSSGIYGNWLNSGRIARNIVTGCTVDPGYLFATGDGLALYSSESVRIETNQFFDNTRYGLLLESTRGGVVRDNIARGNKTGIAVLDTVKVGGMNFITRNYVFGYTQHGFEIDNTKDLYTGNFCSGTGTVEQHYFTNNEGLNGPGDNWYDNGYR
jgi:parallel beta-helix repeat protein